MQSQPIGRSAIVLLLPTVITVATPTVMQTISDSCVKVSPAVVTVDTSSGQASAQAPRTEVRAWPC